MGSLPFAGVSRRRQQKPSDVTIASTCCICCCPECPLQHGTGIDRTPENIPCPTIPAFRSPTLSESHDPAPECTNFSPRWGSAVSWGSIPAKCFLQTDCNPPRNRPFGSLWGFSRDSMLPQSVLQHFRLGELFSTLNSLGGVGVKWENNLLATFADSGLGENLHGFYFLPIGSQPLRSQPHWDILGFDEKRISSLLHASRSRVRGHSCWRRFQRVTFASL